MITLATLPNATAQEVFTQVKNHLLKQNVKAYADGACVYRTPEGLMCAAGCLMSDDEAAKLPMSRGYPFLVRDNKVPYQHSRLIGALQLVHDQYDVADWPEHLKSIAIKFRVNYDL